MSVASFDGIATPALDGPLRQTATPKRLQPILTEAHGASEDYMALKMQFNS
jgi:hypothetical protein